jgi:hypothetical protein
MGELLYTFEKTVFVIANKTWEADPLVGVLLAKKARPRSINGASIDPVGHPFVRKFQNGPDQNGVRPRLRFDLAPTKFAIPVGVDEHAHEKTEEAILVTHVVVWCIEDLLDPDDRRTTSSTLLKNRALRSIFATSQPDFVVAFGTAGLPDLDHCNGCVVIGSRVFIHDDSRTSTPAEDRWNSPSARLLESSVAADFFRTIPDEVRHSAEARMLAAPIHPAAPPVVMAGHSFTSIGIVNVTNWDDYTWADGAGCDEFRTVMPKGRVGSVETTHGLIRTQSEAPFLFVSAITDTDGLFDREVSPRPYSQNFACAHNGGVAVAWLLPAIADQLAADEVGKRRSSLRPT